MKKFAAVASLTALAATTAQAGIIAIPPSVAVPVDSPWMLAGIAALLAVVGARIISNRRK